jgi:AcrR family transcriptional regulator
MSLENVSGTRRTRRSGDEVRAKLLAAARELFAERGYAGTSTKAIARHAEVGEVLLFRHFGSKAGLFDEAVLAPFENFVDEYAKQWARHDVGQWQTVDLAREYIGLLYSFFEENRQLVVALLAARQHHPLVGARLDKLYRRLQRIVREGNVEFGLPTRDPAITVRLTFGMVLAAVIHSDILFPGGQPLSRTKLVDQLTRYMLHGIAHIEWRPTSTTHR